MKRTLFALSLLSYHCHVFCIDFQSALDRTLAHSPILKISESNVHIKHSEAYQTSLYPNPIASVDIDDGVTYSVSQLIEWQEKRAARQSVFNSAKEIASWEYKATEHKLVRDLTVAFIEAFKAKEELQIAEDRKKLCEDLVAIVSKKVDAGKANESIHLAKARINCHLSQINARKLLKNYEDSKRILATFWGSSCIDFEIEFSLPELYCPPALCSLTGYLGDSPEIGRSREAILGSFQNKRLQKVNRYPDVEVTAGYANTKNDRGFILGFDIPIPLFDQNQGNICRSEWDLYRAEKENEFIYTKLENELASLYSQWKNVYEEALVYENEIMPSITNTCHAIMEGYKVGKLDLQQVLETHESCYEIEIQYLNLIAQYYVLEANILQLLGRNL